MQTHLHYIIWYIPLHDNIIENYRVWVCFIIISMCVCFFYFNGHTAIAYILRYKWYIKMCVQYVMIRSMHSISNSKFIYVVNN